MRLFRPNPSGGMSYHLLAMRRSASAWRSYRENLGKWLVQVGCSDRTLLIVGASGGYTLPETLFRNSKVHAVFDPDPWAPIFFRKVHREAEITWHSRDFFVALAEEERSFPRLFHSLGLPDDTVVFFTNLLGQLEYLTDDYARLQSELGRALRDVEWVSLHDRFCTDLPLRMDSGAGQWSRLTRRWDDSGELARRFFLPRGEERAEVEEHDLDALWKAYGEREGDWAYFPWEIRSGWTHLVEAVHFRRM